MIGTSLSDCMGERLGQPNTPANQARAVFARAERLFKARAYRKAIILFERVRHMPGVPNPERLLYNIGLANLKLRRFATAIIYFESFLAHPSISDGDRERAQEKLNEAKRGAGVS